MAQTPDTRSLFTKTRCDDGPRQRPLRSATPRPWRRDRAALAGVLADTDLLLAEPDRQLPTRPPRPARRSCTCRPCPVPVGAGRSRARWSNTAQTPTPGTSVLPLQLLPRLPSTRSACPAERTRLQTARTRDHHRANIESLRGQLRGWGGVRQPPHILHHRPRYYRWTRGSSCSVHSWFDPEPARPSRSRCWVAEFERLPADAGRPPVRRAVAGRAPGADPRLRWRTSAEAPGQLVPGGGPGTVLANE